MALGDVNSNERGAGARYNDGKAPVELIPLSLIAMSSFAGGVMSPDPKAHQAVRKSLLSLGKFQTTGQVDYLDQSIQYARHYWLEAARVFDYGRAKYAAWNWAKGMQWNAVLGCAGRHARSLLIDFELLDPESKLPHVGHYLCNLVMLRTYFDSYPEGNDLPPAQFFQTRIQDPE